MRCPRKRKDREATVRYKGCSKTYICAGIDHEPDPKGDVICFCIRSLDAETMKPKVVIELGMRPEEALEASAALSEGTKDWLLKNPAYHKVLHNKSNELGECNEGIH